MSNCDVVTQLELEATLCHSIHSAQWTTRTRPLVAVTSAHFPGLGFHQTVAWLTACP